MSKYLDLAIKSACKNPVKSRGRNSISRFAAVLTDGRNLFVGLNSYRTHPLQAKFGTNSKCIHIHAELDAIIQAIRCHGRQLGKHYSDVTNLSGYSMFVARVLGNGTPGIALPCVGCQRAIQTFNIKHIEWTI